MPGLCFSFSPPAQPRSLRGHLQDSAAVPRLAWNNNAGFLWSQFPHQYAQLEPTPSSFSVTPALCVVEGEASREIQSLSNTRTLPGLGWHPCCVCPCSSDPSPAQLWDAPAHLRCPGPASVPPCPVPCSLSPFSSWEGHCWNAGERREAAGKAGHDLF